MTRRIKNRTIRNSDIAVIGIAGRFPGAPNYEALWENLVAGRSSVQEVPKNRWDWESYWGDPKNDKNKSNSKWGGFLDQVEAFDADFFGLSAREVELMDPQQRIMLELTWSCLEDAGIPPRKVSGEKVGTFLGVFNFDYKELQEKGSGRSIEAHHSTGTASAIIANRISFYYNLKGPSMPIDTACSSSLNAIHCAVQSLVLNECTMALAGGINLLLTPTRHISFSKTGMLSPTGSCKTFDDRADGYVRGEGAGLVLLKPLKQALADNDHIWGVIKGTAVNHSGRTYSLTYPNPDAQRDVILEAQKAGDVTPETITYVEAHGTGTPKGDPMEFKGLVDAFTSSRHGVKGAKNYCGLSSIKTNVGHLEAAAGIAGLIKVLLSMRHQVIPPLQNFTQLNHRISLENSPFYLVTKPTPWRPGNAKRNKPLPRRAGVSSFGFGGTNAHIVVEEAPTPRLVKNPRNESIPYYMVCISAKTDQGLLQKEDDLIDWLKKKSPLVHIRDISKTLASGREHFEKRTVVIAASAEDLLDKLTKLRKNEKVSGCHRNGASKEKSPEEQLVRETADSIERVLASKKRIAKETYFEKLAALAEIYLNGYDVDWDKPWFGQKGNRISMPAFPFAKTHHWISNDPGDFTTATVQPHDDRLQVLLGRNTSDFQCQRYSTAFSGKEFFIKDHVIEGKKILPAVVYMEMVRAGLEEACQYTTHGSGPISIKNMVWSRPFLLEDSTEEIHVSLFPTEDGFEFKFFKGSLPASEAVVYSEGVISHSADAGKSTVSYNLETLKKTDTQKVLRKEECYSILSGMGFNYGPSHQALEEVVSSRGTMLAKIRLPAVVSETANLFFLHPSIVDATLQASILEGTIVYNDTRPRRPFLPFALDEIEMIKPCAREMWAVIRTRSDNNAVSENIRKVDIDMVDEQGDLCVRMSGFSFKLLDTPGSLSGHENKNRVLLATSEWKDLQPDDVIDFSTLTRRLVIFCGVDAIPQSELKKFPGIEVRFLKASHEGLEERYQFYALTLLEEIQPFMKHHTSGKRLMQVVIGNTEEDQVLAGLSGMLRTAMLESPDVIAQLIQLSASVKPLSWLVESSRGSAVPRMRYSHFTPQERHWKEITHRQGYESVPWKPGGVYLITGGARGVGYLFAREIVSRVNNVSLVLTGRSAIDNTIEEKIRSLRSAGATVVYRSVDVADRSSVLELVKTIRQEFKYLSGIIHSAGLLRDNFIIRKQPAELSEVFRPKVAGTTYLDEATGDMVLDFFILFSSVTGIRGNAGQADYAAANGFLDEFAIYRNSLVTKKQRHGHTLSIAWPLWKDGGMKLEKEMENTLLQQWKMSLLDTASGISALYDALDSKCSNAMIASGDLLTLREEYLNTSRDRVTGPSPGTSSEPVAGRLAVDFPDSHSEEKVTLYFKELLSSVIRRPVPAIDEDVAMERYGIDSIMIMQMTNRLETVFGSLPKTLFFEFQNIRELSRYFVDHHSEKLSKVLASEKEMSAIPVAKDKQSIEDVTVEHRGLHSGLRFVASQQKELVLNAGASQEKAGNPLDIAIIGMAGKYPQADNLEEFWNNLRNGKDCITEIPKDRWDYHPFFDADKDKEGKSYSKWGGFINDVDKFDPLFFNITPLEAERMDPQERLFLQCVYEAIEDAGYTRQSLAEKTFFGLGNPVGVYVGVMYEEYQLYGAQEALYGRPVALWGLPSSIANRVSYFCDFHGPSMAIDTMCSSSLTAIHLACESIARGKCEVAIAGGVNVSVHPNKYLFLSQGRFASSKGRCESFGIGGDGYVPGEGVGAVLLKPLAAAIADGDNIYGVIKSTAVNHGGKTNGYTVPNPRAQASVIRHAFEEAGIDPRSLSYLEAHGTGTSLGDPVEILGLSKTFSEYTSDVQFCAIGSAKSNIGHCESAAGIAGVTKVLLQLKNQQLVPSLHSETLNANIDFRNSPFVVQQKLTNWERPVISNHEGKRELPRRAGISSFGAGGANAHVVIEEYVRPVHDLSYNSSSVNVKKTDPVLILLSAKDLNALEQRARDLLSAISQNDRKLSDPHLADIAYTLQVGREHMESRWAFKVDSLYELKMRLQDALFGNLISDGSFYTSSNISENSDGRKSPKLTSEAVRSFVQNKQYDQLLQQWVDGAKIDWLQVVNDTGASLNRVSLPTYPFRKERYWIGSVVERQELSEVSAPSKLHPLLHENISDITGQKFLVSFSGEEFFIKDHVVNDKKIVPAAAYLEMIRESIERTLKPLNHQSKDIHLKEIRWIQPCIVSPAGTTLRMKLHYEEGGQVTFSIFSKPSPEEQEIFCEGSASIEPLREPEVEAVSHLQEWIGNSALTKVSKETCYDRLQNSGLCYGPSFLCLQELFIGSDRLIAKAVLPEKLPEESSYTLCPPLVDSALQATLFWNWRIDLPLTMFLPSSVKSVRVFRPVASAAWIVIYRVNPREPLREGYLETERIFNVAVLAESGELCLQLNGISFKKPSIKTLAGNLNNTYLLVPAWQQKENNAQHKETEWTRWLVFICGFRNFPDHVSLPEGAEVTVVKPGDSGDFTEHSLQFFETIQSVLKAKPKGKVVVQVVVPDGGDSVYSAWDGLLRTARKENPALHGQVIHLADETTVAIGLNDMLQKNIQAISDQRVRYTQAREVMRWKMTGTVLVKETATGYPWKDRGVYLITGGTGALGLIIADEIIERTANCVLILTGRTLPSESLQTKIRSRSKNGARVVYRQANVMEQQSVRALMLFIRNEFGGLHGIIHSAGITRDNFIINKSSQEYKEVLGPKVDGLQCLDIASQDEPLDFFMLFSSVTGALGNLGQADYATANAFMDRYASYRNRLVEKGSRHGHTLSINWPLWQEGGMHVGEESKQYLFDTMGITPLGKEEGLAALYAAWNNGYTQVMVLQGDEKKIREQIIQEGTGAEKSSAESIRYERSSNDQFLPEAIQYLKKLLASEVKLPLDRIKPETPLEEYGIDSVMVMKMTGRLEKIFGTLSKTLFFEYQNIKDLASYFLHEHFEALATVLGLSTKVEFPDTVHQKKIAAHSSESIRLLTTEPEQKEKTPHQNSGSYEIAIIGIDGKYPDADNLNMFWKNLRNGKNSIVEIPEDRWNYHLYFDPDRDTPGKTYSKWGGFLRAVDEFDPLFFNISPREAELMDPQERLFLQCAYSTLEDAGYSRELLSEEKGLAGNIGVYVGVMYEEYQLYGAQESVRGRNIALFGNPSSVANRVSYYFNFNGPSMAVDTMCSSSLTAIHLACQSILSGECKAAIAGGVNVSIHPNKYLLLAQGKFISSKGQCESFGTGGDGYVPGEGVGAVFLKPLSQAIAEGDHIYGVIKASSINHGGKTNGYTVPNPNAQASVIRAAYKRSGIDPRTISCFEAHGTGTVLGDPIEITGLKKVFREYTSDNNFCSIGSVKSNIGHGESAAGISGLTKLVLQLKYKTLVPSLHSNDLNPNIDFKNSPFFVQQNVAEWQRPVIEVNGEAKEFPRRAGISSFGAGGSNAHLIIEEFDDSRIQQFYGTATGRAQDNDPAIILLSAKNEERLKELVEAFLTEIRRGTYQDADLHNIAFTLQTGRNALEARIAVMVTSLDELKNNLEAFVHGSPTPDKFFKGRVEHNDNALEAFQQLEEFQEVVDKWIGRKKYTSLCEFWVKGAQIKWSKIYQDRSPGLSPRRISLPAYPFARERYWVPRGPDNGHGMLNDKKERIASENFKILTFREEWVEQNIDGVLDGHRREAGRSLRKIVCFLSELEYQQTLHESFRQVSPETELIFAHFAENSRASCTTVLNDISARHGAIDAVMYLRPLEDQRRIEDYHPIVYLLQALRDVSLHACKVIVAGQWTTEDPVNALDRCFCESWIGFVRSLRMVLPDNQFSVVYHRGSREKADMSVWGALLWQELQVTGNQEVLYQQGKRFIPKVTRTNLEKGETMIKTRGTYLITGGMGGLGVLFAKYFAKKYYANLVLTGRSPLTTEKRKLIDELNQYDNKVVYLQADVCNEEKMKASWENLPQDLRTINGVLHAAGVENERSILDKSITDFDTVLSSKIKGTIVLDQLLEGEPLDFMCYFSSSSAFLGDFGSCDYSVANRFQMSYAGYRSGLERAGQRSGKSIAINWPLWREGGMNLKASESSEMYLKSSGQRYLETNEGIELFERLLSAEGTHHLVLTGVESRISKLAGDHRVAPTQVREIKSPIELTSSLEETVEQDISSIVSELLKITKERINVYENFADIGFDSVTLTKFARILSNHFSLEIVPALFFSYSTIEKLVGYLKDNHSAQLGEVYSTSETKSTTTVHAEPAPAEKTNEKITREAHSHTLPHEPVAIIGMSGRFPQARTIGEMWTILKEGLSAITEIPEDRFDWQMYYSGEAMKEGKTISKWTGVIPGFREFDPLFFEISPSEARTMDPRQRLLLQEGWKALEDAGYGDRLLEQHKVALFVGAEENFSAPVDGGESITSHHNAILAARLSYFLNLSGPNMAINTSCSSGLVAAHQAFQCLQSGDCDVAIAAGVNLMATPEPYIAMSQAGMLSPDGNCHAFDKRANGMVPGEAVVVVVLKRLSDAIADGDPIYATIVGSGINYDGKTNGITAPSGLSQTALLRSVYEKFKIDPEQIGYIVTHGTGTRLGDPVEINALNDAFRSFTQKKGYCALTSVKTNLGHTFAASGLVSLVSLVQAMRYEAIPASLNCTDESDYVQWERSPFFINRSLKPWPQQAEARTGCVSSFGMSGTNAHMVVRHYRSEKKPAAAIQSYYLLPLSAKSTDSLQAKICDLIAAMEDPELSAHSLAEVSYTLMAGRHHFKFRQAVVVSDLQDAISVLKQILHNGEHTRARKGEVSSTFKATGETRRNIGEMMNQASGAQKEQLKDILLSLADHYCKGYVPDWDKLYPFGKPQRIHLPTYPFSTAEYGVAKNDKKANGLISQASSQQPIKEWLFFREELVSSPVEDNVDWANRLTAFLGKNICIVYSDPVEKDEFLNLLKKVETASQIQASLRITTIHIREVSSKVNEILPDIVLYLGTPGQPFEGTVSDPAGVFELSKALMQGYWDKPLTIFYLYHSDPATPNMEGEALSGFFRSAMKENELHAWKVIRTYAPEDLSARFRILLRELFRDDLRMRLPDPYAEIHYQHGSRFVKVLTETTFEISGQTPFRVGGNYLVAGGTGYIGGLLMKEMARRHRVNLYLLSRGEEDDNIRERRRSIEQYGGTLHFYSADVTDLKQLEMVYTRIKKSAGSIHGVINLARAHQSNGIITKSWQSFNNVSQVKIRSTRNLDLVTKDEPLDLFVLFASIGAYGARGESDYAFSVAYQNTFAGYRDQLKSAGKRSGVTVSQAWGPWEEDKLFPESRAKLKSAGFDLIDMASAFPRIESSLTSAYSSIGLVAVLDKERVKKILGLQKNEGSPVKASDLDRFERWITQWENEKRKGRPFGITDIQKFISEDDIKIMDPGLVDRLYNLCLPERDPGEVEKGSNGNAKHSGLGHNKALEIVRQAIMEILQIEMLDNERPLQQYGLDSILAMRLSLKLGRSLSMEVLPRWFIEFPTASELTKHLVSEKAAAMNKIVGHTKVPELTVLNDCTALIRETVRTILQLEEFDNETPFQDYGLDSIIAMRLSIALEKRLNREVKPNLFLEYPTVKELAGHLNYTNQFVLN